MRLFKRGRFCVMRTQVGSRQILIFGIFLVIMRKEEVGWDEESRILKEPSR